MDYYDYAEAMAVLDELAASRNVAIEQIGISTDFTKTPAVDYPIRAIRVSALKATTVSKPNVATKSEPPRPAVLIDGGIHPPEWLAAESVIELAKHLVEQSRLPTSRTAQALNRVDVWLIPMSTPAGRVIDDPKAGNPLGFFKGGPDPGGWRGNGDTRGSPHAIDVARNFSHDWAKAPADPTEKHWRGPAPFFAHEAAALRQFVQNHPIAMAVHVHSNSQDIATVWDEGNRSGFVIRRRAGEEWLKGCGRMANQLARPLDDLKLVLNEQRMATSVGQYASWLVAPSDTPDQPDFGTVRAIQTVGIELPFDNSKLGNYYDKDFQYKSKDGTNSFHPSGAKTRLLLREGFIPMAMYLIEQAAAPFCAIRVEGKRLVPEKGGQPATDVGIMAATIGHSPGTGTLKTVPAVERTQNGTTTIAPAFDCLQDGEHTVSFWIQNYGLKSADSTVNVLVEYRDAASGTWTGGPKTTKRFLALTPLAHRFGEAPLRVAADREYRVTIEAVSNEDRFPLNDRKIFRFLGSGMKDENRQGDARLRSGSRQ